MAHFAELNSSNEVLRVVVISNTDVDANGGDQHADAETFVASIVPHATGGTAWKQTSYNNNFRKQYAGMNYVYNTSKNKFLVPQPYASWTLNDSDDWQAPVTYPNAGLSDYEITWDEDNTRWIGTKLSDESKHRWNADTKAWVAL